MLQEKLIVTQTVATRPKQVDTEQHIKGHYGPPLHLIPYEDLITKGTAIRTPQKESLSQTNISSRGTITD